MNHVLDLLNSDALRAVSAFYSMLPPDRPSPDEAYEFNAHSGDAFASLRGDMKLCIRCHGEDGNATASGMPNLTGQSSDYFVDSMLAYTNGNRDHRMMTRLVKKLDADTLQRMGVFYAIQQPVKTSVIGEGNPDLGRELAAECSSCHGEDGNIESALMPTLAGQDALYFIKAMQAYKDGSRQHDAMFEAVAELAESDIENLAAFYAGQQPVRRNERAPLTVAQWIDRCERCHGIEGNSTDPRIPMLAGQDSTYLKNALEAYRTKTRTSTAMHAMSEPLSGEQIEQITAYYASRKPKSVLFLEVPCEEYSTE